MSTTIDARPTAMPEAGAARTMPVTTPPRRVLYVEQNRDGTTGGSYRSLLFLLRGLDRSRFTPIVAFYREHELMQAFQAAGCRTMLLWYPAAYDLVSGLRQRGAFGRALLPLARLTQKVLNLAWVSTALFVRNLWLLATERIEVLHLNNGVTVGAEFLVAAKVLRLGCVISQRGITDVPRWCEWFARRADHVICVSDAARANLIAHGLSAERCTAIHNGMDPEVLQRQIQRSPSEIRATLGIAPAAPIVGLAGMIKEWKGQMVLVKAMHRLRKAHPDLRAIIMGGVSDRDPHDQAYLREMQQYIAEHELARSIMLIGYQPNAPEYLQTFDVMVHTAIEPEPFSRVVIEGMALSRAIVASATGGTPEAIEDGVTGFLVPANDPDALAGRIDLLLREPELREKLGRGAREKVERQFHIKSHIARTQAVYQRLLGDVQA